MFLFLYFVLALNIISAFSNNVPVCMWGTVPLLDKTPALTFLEKNTFQNNLSQILGNTLLVVFAETSLSVEDFKTEKFDEKPFPFLREQGITYLQNVENPIQAWKNLSSNILEIPSENFRVENLTANHQNQTVLIIRLDTKQTKNARQNRFELLKRHDDFINSTYNKIVNKFKNVIAVYSGLARTKFPAFAKSPAPNMYVTSHALLRILPESQFRVHGKNKNLKNISVSTRNSEAGIALTLSNKQVTVDINLEIHNTFWTISTVDVNISEQVVSFVMKPIIRADLKNAYFCKNLTLMDYQHSLRLVGLLIQPNILNGSEFTGDVENCIGFFSIPIVVGLAISGFFVFVAGIAIEMMMSIKTMDRFNDSRHSIVTAPTGD